MLDIKYIREHADLVKQAVIDKQMTVDIDALLAFDDERRQLITEYESLRAEQTPLIKPLLKPLVTKNKPRSML